MRKVLRYDNETTYMFPSGEIATPEVIRSKFPAIEYFEHIMVISGNVCQSIQELASMRDFYAVDDNLTNEEAIQIIQDIINAPQPEPEPTAEERIASALEYQNMMSI